MEHFVLSNVLVAGCDEAGRGCLAGPVFAAAVILPDIPDVSLAEGLKDSKALTTRQREKLRAAIENNAVAFAVEQVDHHEIDRINILQASIRAMHLALARLKPQPGHVIVDGNRFHPYAGLPYQCFVKGDARFLSIAAASVLAKTWRDAYMEQIHYTYPLYGWDKNKGYPTAFHRAAVDKFGLSPLHRKTFRSGHISSATGKGV